MLEYLVIIVAYLIGSIPFGYLAARLLAREDIRKHGSGNIGATNVMRVLGPAAALMVLLFDVGKGILTVLLAKAISDQPLVHLASALAVVIGHSWPVWLKFRGGKGAATGIGVLIPLFGWLAVIVVLFAGIVMMISRYVSLGSMLGALSLPLILLVFNFDAPYIYFSLALAALIILRHRSNIGRLLKGAELRIGKPNRGTDRHKGRRR